MIAVNYYLIISYVEEYLVPSACEADNRVAQSITIPVCMYIRHNLIRMGSLVTHVYRHDTPVVTMTRMQVLHEWTLMMKHEQSLRDHAS